MPSNYRFRDPTRRPLGGLASIGLGTRSLFIRGRAPRHCTSIVIGVSAALGSCSDPPSEPDLSEFTGQYELVLFDNQTLPGAVVWTSEPGADGSYRFVELDSASLHISIERTFSGTLQLRRGDCASEEGGLVCTSVIASRLFEEGRVKMLSSGRPPLRLIIDYPYWTDSYEFMTVSLEGEGADQLLTLSRMQDDAPAPYWEDPYPWLPALNSTEWVFRLRTN